MGYVMKGVQGGHQCAGLLNSLTGRLVEQIDDRKRGREENKKMGIYLESG
jgi:hypothetical protein